MPDSATQQANTFYDNSSHKWTNSHNSERFWGEYMDRFRTLLTSGSVLEIGFGGGRDAEELLALGYDYLGIDPSGGMLQVAQARNPEGNFLQMAVEDEESMASLGIFDGFWASASLLHRPKKSMDAALQNISKRLRPGAVGFISLKKFLDDGPDEREVTNNLGTRPFSFWSKDEFTAVLKRNGFELIDPVSEKPMSADTVWLVFLVRKVA